MGEKDWLTGLDNSQHVKEACVNVEAKKDPECAPRTQRRLVGQSGVIEVSNSNALVMQRLAE